MDPAELENRFKYHQPRSEDVADQHQSVRGLCDSLAYRLNQILPEGREKSLAMTKLEEVMFWSNAAIARNQP